MEHPRIQEYALIGNQDTSALVSVLGSIEWLCMPYLDSSSHFSEALSYPKGGKFQIAPFGEFRSRQQYFVRTLILETLFETPTGRGIVTDWIPFESSRA